MSGIVFDRNPNRTKIKLEGVQRITLLQSNVPMFNLFDIELEKRGDGWRIFDKVWSVSGVVTLAVEPTLELGAGYSFKALLNTMEDGFILDVERVVFIRYEPEGNVFRVDFSGMAQECWTKVGKGAVEG